VYNKKNFDSYHPQPNRYLRNFITNTRTIFIPKAYVVLVHAMKADREVEVCFCLTSTGEGGEWSASLSNRFIHGIMAVAVMECYMYPSRWITWLKMLSSECFNESGYEPSGSRLGVSWPAEQLLPPQEGFCSVEFVCYDF
jgi:hypothetical protein